MHDDNGAEGTNVENLSSHEVIAVKLCFFFSLLRRFLFFAYTHATVDSENSNFTQ